MAETNLASECLGRQAAALPGHPPGTGLVFRDLDAFQLAFPVVEVDTLGALHVC